MFWSRSFFEPSRRRQGRLLKKRIKVVIALTGLTLATLHIINRVITSVATMKELLLKKKNNTFNWRFGEIHYTKKGSGKPVLLIHDLTYGSSSYEFHKIENELAKTNEVYSIDLLGYGLSDKPNITYTNYLFVELVTEFIKKVIGKRTDMITSGDSSAIAVMACRNNPDIINKMIFINPQDVGKLSKIPGKRTKMLKFLLETPILGTFIYNIFCNKKNITNKFLNEYFSCAGKIEENDILAYFEAAHYKDYSSKYATTSYLSHYTNININHALSEINYSMYIISGTEKENSHVITESYLGYNPSIEHCYINNTKQLPHMESPKETLEAILLFLN